MQYLAGSEFAWISRIKYAWKRDEANILKHQVWLFWVMGIWASILLLALCSGLCSQSSCFSPLFPPQTLKHMTQVTLFEFLETAMPETIALWISSFHKLVKLIWAGFLLFTTKRILTGIVKQGLRGQALCPGVTQREIPQGIVLLTVMLLRALHWAQWLQVSWAKKKKIKEFLSNCATFLNFYVFHNVRLFLIKLEKNYFRKLKKMWCM